MARTPSTAPVLTELSKALRFAIVGGVATLLHYAVAMSALAMGAGAFQSNAMGFAVAFVAGIFGHFYFTFGLSDGFLRSAMRYGLIACAGFGVNNGLLAVLKAAEVLPVSASLTVAILIVPVGTFLAARLWGFQPRN